MSKLYTQWLQAIKYYSENQAGYSNMHTAGTKPISYYWDHWVTNKQILLQHHT